MKGPSLLSGITFAIVACVAGSVLYTVLPLVLSAAMSLEITISVLSASYLFFLLKKGRQHSGRVIAFTAWILISGTSLLIDLPTSYFILSQVTMIWLARSIIFHRSILPSLLDLGLIAIGLLAAVWALLQTDSMATALWCFFLVQSLFGTIPAFKLFSKDHPPADQDKFQVAHRVAADAIHKLTFH
jgi:hypothetical protein